MIKVVEEKINYEPAHTVYFDGRRVISFRYQPTAKERAEEVARRLKPFSSRWPERVALSQRGGMPVILADGAVLVTVDDVEAAMRLMSVSELANRWLSQIRQALSPPSLLPEPEQLVIPRGENRFVTIGGGAKGALEILECPRELIECEFDEAKEKLRLLGLTVGSGAVKIRRQRVYREISFKVMRYAGTFVAPRPVVITGRGLPFAFLSEELRHAAMKSARPEYGAHAEVVSVEESGLPAPGTTRPFGVRVEIKGPGYLPLTKQLEVPVTSELLPYQQPSRLVVCNEPEKITEQGILSQHLLFQGEAIRYLTHHMNSTRTKMHLYLKLRNDGEATAQVQVVEGDGGPVRDELQAGFRAAQRFFRRYLDQAGRIVELVPGETRYLVNVSLAPREVYSSLYYLRMVQGDKVHVETGARNPHRYEPLYPFPLVPTPRWGTFKDEEVVREATYEVGDRWAFVKMGDEKLNDPRYGQALEGNYGIFYRFRFILRNPKDWPWPATITFHATAGPSAAVFLVDGNWIEVKANRSHEEKQIVRHVLEPRQTKVVELLTFPVAGGHYPSVLIAHD